MSKHLQIFLTMLPLLNIQPSSTEFNISKLLTLMLAYAGVVCIQKISRRFKLRPVVGKLSSTLAIGSRRQKVFLIFI